MKATIHIPTTPYGYIEVEVEGEPKEIISKHNELVEEYKGSLSKEELDNNW